MMKKWFQRETFKNWLKFIFWEKRRSRKQVKNVYTEKKPLTDFASVNNLINYDYKNKSVFLNRRPWLSGEALDKHVGFSD